MSSRAAGTALCFAAALLLGGCVPRRSPNPFVVRHGGGPIDVGKEMPHSKSDAANVDRARRDAVEKRAAQRPTPAPSIERIDPALRQALAFLETHESAEAHVHVAFNYWRLGVFDAAYDHYSDALRLDRKNVAAWDGRARVWRHWGVIEPALHDVHWAIFYGPANPEPRNTLGTILEAAGQCSAAREAYANALKLDPSAEWARTNLDRLVCK